MSDSQVFEPIHTYKTTRNLQGGKIKRVHIFKWVPKAKSVKHRKDITELFTQNKKVKSIFFFLEWGGTPKVWVTGLKELNVELIENWKTKIHITTEQTLSSLPERREPY